MFISQSTELFTLSLSLYVVMLARPSSDASVLVILTMGGGGCYWCWACVPCFINTVRGPVCSRSVLQFVLSCRIMEDACWGMVGVHRDSEPCSVCSKPRPHLFIGASFPLFPPGNHISTQNM